MQSEINDLREQIALISGSYYSKEQHEENKGALIDLMQKQNLFQMALSNFSDA